MCGSRVWYRTRVENPQHALPTRRGTTSRPHPDTGRRSGQTLHRRRSRGQIGRRGATPHHRPLEKCQPQPRRGSVPHKWERWTLKTRRLPGWWPRVVASPVPWQVRARGSRHTGGRPVRTLSTLPRDPTARHLRKRETSSVCKCPQLETAPGSCHEGQTGNHPLDESRLGVERNQLLPQAQVSPDPLRRAQGPVSDGRTLRESFAWHSPKHNYGDRGQIGGCQGRAVGG